MKIQCDVCEKAPATVICCADEAALCARCDVEVHAANKLASKHQRLLLQCLSNKLPRCDICQAIERCHLLLLQPLKDLMLQDELSFLWFKLDSCYHQKLPVKYDKPAFIFCVEDRALFCRDCDEPIHSAGSLSANHQRFLATGIRVALSSSSCNKGNEKGRLEPPNHNSEQISVKTPSQLQQVPGFTSSSWAVDDLLEFTDFGSPEKKESIEFGELEWLSDIGLFGDQFPQETSAAAEVPQLPVTQTSNVASYKASKSSYLSHKKPRIEYLDEDDEEHFTVPDLG